MTNRKPRNRKEKLFEGIACFLFIFKTRVLQFLNEVTLSVQGLPTAMPRKSPEITDHHLLSGDIFLYIIFMANNDFPSPA